MDNTETSAGITEPRADYQVRMSPRCSLFKYFLEKEGKAFLTKRSRAEDKGEKTILVLAKAFGC